MAVGFISCQNYVKLQLYIEGVCPFDFETLTALPRITRILRIKTTKYLAR